MAPSGVVISTTLEFKTWWVGPSNGCPAPIARTAARAVDMDRPVTPPTHHPSSCKRRPRARPTRPAPTMDTLSDIRCVSIPYAAIDRLRTLYLCTLTGLYYLVQ